jgi:hypothetical protein
MRVFAEKTKATQQTTSDKSTKPGQAHPSKKDEQIGNQAALGPIEANTLNVVGDSTPPKVTRVGHDFSRIPVYPRVPAKAQAKPSVNIAGDVIEQQAYVISDRVMAMPPSPDRQPNSAAGYPNLARAASPLLNVSFGKLPTQPKLRVGAVDDPLEREADQVADTVMRMPRSRSGRCARHVE